MAERYNRILQEGALTLQHDADLSPRFWVSGMHTVNFIRNRVLHSRLGIPHMRPSGKPKPHIDWLRIYGCKCWALILKAIWKKREYRLIEGIFVGYYDNSKAYKVWIPRTRSIIKVRDVIFDESNHIKHIIIHAMDKGNLPNLWANKCLPSTSTPILSDDIPPTADHGPLPDKSNIETPTINTYNLEVIHEESHPHEASIITPSEDPTETIPAVPKDFK